MPKIVKACPGCGTEFAFYASWPRVYCSNRCKGIANASNLGSRMQPLGAVPQRACEQCDQPLEGQQWRRRRFCSRRCYGDWLKAHGTPPTGGVRPITRVTVSCPICAREFQVKQSHVERRRFCSKACLGKHMTETRCGEANFAWRGGPQPYYGPTWRAAQRLVRERDRACQRCGVTPDALGKALDVHHLASFRSFGVERHAEANRVENLIALCARCHLQVEWETNRREGVTANADH